MNNNNMLAILSIAAISAGLLLLFSSNLAFAQQQGGKACPDGFQLNKGVCQAPVIVTTTEECPPMYS